MVHMVGKTLKHASHTRMFLQVPCELNFINISVTNTYYSTLYHGLWHLLQIVFWLFSFSVNAKECRAGFLLYAF